MRKLSIKQTLSNDYLALILALTGPLFVAAGLFADAFGFVPRRRRSVTRVDPEFAADLVFYGSILTVLLLGLLIWRVYRINSIITKGTRVKAWVVDIGFIRDRGRVEYEYTVYGRVIRSGTAIMKNAKTTALQVGDQIELALVPGNPEKALFLDLYLEPGPSTDDDFGELAFAESSPFAAPVPLGPNDSASPGLDAIQSRLEKLYPGKQPRHWVTAVSDRLDGSDPLERVSAYAASSPGHWHYVGMGLSELFAKETTDPGTSGWGFELTFRVASNEAEPPLWPVVALQEMARYVIQSGSPLAPGHYIDNKAPITAAIHTGIHAVAIVDDPALGSMSTVHGRFRFLQVVGLTADELLFVQSWNTRRFLELAARQNPLLVTDMARTSWLEHADFRALAEKHRQVEGSSTEELYVEHASWVVEPLTITLQLDLDAIAGLRVILPARLSHGRTFSLVGPERTIEFLPGKVGSQQKSTSITLSFGAAEAQAFTDGLQVISGVQQVPGLPWLRIAGIQKATEAMA